MNNEPLLNSEIIFYTSPEGSKKIEVSYRDENFWLTQKAMAELFGVQRPAITKHLKNIIETGELLENSVRGSVSRRIIMMLQGQAVTSSTVKRVTVTNPVRG